MEIKILQVFYGKDGLPYKDKNRQVHFPITGTGFVGASNTTKIKFYYDELDDTNQTTWVAVSKLPNGKLGSRVLESYFDDELNEHYALLELGEYYTQYKGDVFISLQGYQGGVNLDFDDETQQYEIHGTPTIAATGSIKFTNNYAPQFVGSGQTENINFQRILADLGTKLGIRATSEHVEELPEEGNPNIFYVVNDEPNNPNLENIYIWNSETRHYIWVGDNTLYLGDYFTKSEGELLEQQIQALANGGPKGVFSTVSELTTADPNHNYIYLVTADGHWYYWNGSAWTDGGAYLQGAFDNALNPTSTNAVQNAIVTKEFATTYKYLGGKNLVGEEINVYYAIPPLHAGDTLTFSTSDGNEITVNAVRFYLYDKNKQELEYWTLTTGMGGQRTVTLTSAVTEACYVSINAQNGVPMQLEIGATKTAYEPYKTNIYGFNDLLVNKFYDITTQGDDDRQVIFTLTNAQYGTLSVYIPFRILLNPPFNSKYVAKDIVSSGGVTITLNHAYALYYDLDLNSFSTISVANLPTLTNRQIVVAVNNFGKVRGMWHYYQQDNYIERLQYSEYIVTTQGDADRQVTFESDGTAYGLNVNIPFRILVKPFNGNYETIDIAASGYVTVNLPHSYGLYYDISLNQFNTVAYNSISSLTKKQILVAFNNGGVIRGMWHYYQQDPVIKELKNIDVDITTQGDADRQVTFESDGTAYGLNAKIPFRILVKPYGGIYDRVDIAPSGYVTINMAHGACLYYDMAEQEFSTIDVSLMNTLNINQIVVAYNNGGVIRGRWAYYQQNQKINAQSNDATFKTIEFSNRQGEVGNCPENSLIGFKTAKSYGYNMVRASVQFTSDGVPVCFHDARLNTTGIVYKNGSPTTDNYKISDLTYAQLQDYDFGAYKGSAFANTPICTVEDFIKQSKKLGQKVDLEIKDATDPTTQNLTTLYNIVCKEGMLDYTTFTGYPTTGLDTFTTLNEKCNIGYICWFEGGNQQTLLDQAAALLTGKNKVSACIYSSQYSSVVNDAFMIYVATKGLRLKVGSAYNNNDVNNYIKCDVIECANILNPASYLIGN